MPLHNPFSALHDTSCPWSQYWNSRSFSRNTPSLLSVINWLPTKDIGPSQLCYSTQIWASSDGFMLFIYRCYNETGSIPANVHECSSWKTIKRLATIYHCLCERRRNKYFPMWRKANSYIFITISLFTRNYTYIFIVRRK